MNMAFTDTLYRLPWPPKSLTHDTLAGSVVGCLNVRNELSVNTL